MDNFCIREKERKDYNYLDGSECYLFARCRLSALFAEKLFKICPLIQIIARSVGRRSLDFLTQLAYKSFQFRLVVYKQTDAYTTKFLYARSITRTKDLKNPQGSLHNLLCLCNRQGNPTAECTVKESVIWNSTILQTSLHQQFTLGTFYVSEHFSWEACTIRTLCKYFVKVNMIKQSALSYCFCIYISVILHYCIPFHLYISTHFIAVS